MAKSSFHLYIQHQQQEEIATKIKALFSNELDIEPDKHLFSSKAAENETREFYPIALSSMVLTIPATALATLSILDRMKNKQKTENVLGKIEEIIKEYPQAHIRLEAPDGSVIEVKKEKSGKILNVANQTE